MREERARTVLICAACLLGLFIAWKQLGQFRLLEDVAGMAREKKETGLMGTMTTTWNSAKGTHTLTTVKATSEDNAQHATRHNNELTAMQAIFPKV